MERVVVAFANGEAQRRILRMLESAGCVPAGCFYTGADVIRTVRKLGGAIVVCGFKLRDMTAPDLARNLLGVGVLLVVSSPVNLFDCEGANLLKLPTPAARADFFASLDMLRQLERTALRPPPPQRKEADQRLIQRAKALLMDRNHMTEGEAHRFLQKRSMDTGGRMAETAQWVIDNESNGNAVP